MEEILFKEKFRIESTRLPHWNYSDPGYYFVTICTNYFVEYFGKVGNGRMTMNEWGLIVAQEWVKAPQIRPSVQLDEWIVMPNHLHGIICIGSDPVETSRGTSLPITPDVLKIQNADIPNKPRIHMHAGSVGSIVNHFKGACTSRIRKSCPEFSWQPRFYDHVIRNQDSLDKIRRYIADNSAKWDRDRNRDFMYRV